MFLTPALDERLAVELGRRPTPHLVAPDEAAPGHLFLLPGEHPDAELLRDAEGGVWIGALDAVQSHDPGSLRFRAQARGVRRVRARSARRSAARPPLGGRSPVSPLRRVAPSEASR